MGHQGQAAALGMQGQGPPGHLQPQAGHMQSQVMPHLGAGMTYQHVFAQQQLQQLVSIILSVKFCLISFPPC